MLSGELIEEVAAFKTKALHLGTEVGHIRSAFERGNHSQVVLSCARLAEDLSSVALRGISQVPSDLFHENLRVLRNLGVMPIEVHLSATVLRHLGNDTRHAKKSIDAVDAELATACLEVFCEWFFCGFRHGSKLREWLKPGKQPSGSRPSVAELLRAVRGKGDLQTLARDTELLHRSPIISTVILEVWLQQEGGDPRPARDFLDAALKRFPEDIRLRQLEGLYWRRHFDRAGAKAWLDQLPRQEKGFREDEETAGIAGGLLKHLWRQSGEKDGDALRESNLQYHAAWRRSGQKNNYLGINSATTGLWLGMPRESYVSQIARLVKARLIEQLQSIRRYRRDTRFLLNYYDQVILAEAELLLQEPGALERSKGLLKDAFSREKSPPLQRSTREQVERIVAQLGPALHLDFGEMASWIPFGVGTYVLPEESERSGYRPLPVPTEHIVLPTAIHEMVELFAEQSHEIWARDKIKEGWTHGPVLDPNEKWHPSLTSYLRLSEDEKDKDRGAAIGTLKALVALGYRIDGA